MGATGVSEQLEQSFPHVQRALCCTGMLAVTVTALQTYKCHSSSCSWKLRLYRTLWELLMFGPQRIETAPPCFSDVFASTNFRVYMRLKWHQQVGLSVFNRVIIFPRVRLCCHYLQWGYLESSFYLWVSSFYLWVCQVLYWFNGCYIVNLPACEWGSLTSLP